MSYRIDTGWNSTIDSLLQVRHLVQEGYRMRSLCIVLALTALVLVGGVSMSGCNTVRGMGKDVQSLGHGIEHAFDKR